MFGSKPSTIVLVQRNGIIVEDRRDLSARMTFASDVVQNLEVIDPARLKAQLTQFLDTQPLKGRQIALVFDRSATFEKTIDANQPLPEAEAAFQAIVPFEPGVLQYASSRDDAPRMFAVNKQLADIIRQSLEAHGAKVLSTTPVSAYAIPDDARTKEALLSAILEDKSVANAIKFA